MVTIDYKSDGIIIDNQFIHINDINKQCTLAKIEKYSLVLLVLQWPSRRGFDGICEKIVVSSTKLNAIKDYLTGRYIYFGEIVGKHSEIYGTLDAEEITVVENETEVLNFLLNNPSGYEYNHSFVSRFLDRILDGEYDDIESNMYQTIRDFIYKWD